MGEMSSEQSKMVVSFAEAVESVELVEAVSVEVEVVVSSQAVSAAVAGMVSTEDASGEVSADSGAVLIESEVHDFVSKIAVSL